MKKLIAILAVVAVFGFTACNTAQDSTSDEVEEVDGTETEVEEEEAPMEDASMDDATSEEGAEEGEANEDVIAE